MMAWDAITEVESGLRPMADKAAITHHCSRGPPGVTGKLLSTLYDDLLISYALCCRLTGIHGMYAINV